MALAKLIGFDLCPRLAELDERKLFAPPGVKVPESCTSHPFTPLPVPATGRFGPWRVVLSRARA